MDWNGSDSSSSAPHEATPIFLRPYWTRTRVAKSMELFQSSIYPKRVIIQSLTLARINRPCHAKLKKKTLKRCSLKVWNAHLYSRKNFCPTSVRLCCNRRRIVCHSHSGGESWRMEAKKKNSFNHLIGMPIQMKIVELTWISWWSSRRCRSIPHL